MSAVGALRQLVNPQLTCSACKSLVFDKLSITQNDYATYLSRQPRLWDGTRSYAPANVALCPSGFFNQFFASSAAARL